MREVQVCAFSKKKIIVRIRNETFPPFVPQGAIIVASIFQLIFGYAGVCVCGGNLMIALTGFYVKKSENVNNYFLGIL